MAKDYKRIGEGDTGLNTGGMGAVSPVPFADEAFVQKIKEQVVTPTMQGLHQDGIPYVGFVFIVHGVELLWNLERKCKLEGASHIYDQIHCNITSSMIF